MEKYDTINNKQAKSLLKKLATKYGETSNIYLEIEDVVEQFTLSDDTVNWPQRSVVILNKTLEKCRVLEEMKKQTSIKQKLRRIIREEIVRLSEASNSNDLSFIKKGDSVYRLMTRHNPQLGVYYVWETQIVSRVTPATIIVGKYYDAAYDKKTGMRRGKDGSVYGRTTYQIFTKDGAIEYNKDLISSGANPRGLEV